VSFETDLLTAIGEYLEAQGVGLYDLTGAGYSTAVNPIYWDTLPSTPDRGTAMTLYPLGPPNGTLHEIGLQLRIRGRPNNRVDTKTAADNADNALDGLERVQWAGVEIVHVWRQSGTSLGPDSNNRIEVTRNYYLQYSRETSHRSD
jgi:hypothetical protein